MHAPSAKRCYVVLDETGTFERNDRSAIAGFYTWEPPSEAEFEALWQCVLERPRGNQQIHCNEHARDARKLSRWVERAGAWLARQGWTPFAFEHSTRETIVDNKTTYVNVLADGINRLMRRLTAQRRDKLTVDILAARRTVPQKGRLAPIEPNEYKERIRERLALERTRSLRYRSELCWEYTLRYDVATTHAGLMIADLVCYAWRRRDDLESEAQRIVDGWFEATGFKVLEPDDTERIRLLLGRGEHGQAMLELLGIEIALDQRRAGRPAPSGGGQGEAAAPREGGAELELSRLRQQLLDELTLLNEHTLDIALLTCLDHIRLAEVRRDLASIDRWAQLLRARIITPLQERLPAEQARRLAWAHAQALTYLLAASNHRGATRQAEGYLQALQPLRSQLATHLERLELALEIACHEGVHSMNTCDYIRCAASLTRLGDELQAASDLLASLVHPTAQGTRSEATGKALGTALQAATAAGRRDASWHDTARALSDRALLQFERESDRRRQAGYRAQLETDAGNLDAALAWLAECVGATPGASARTLVEAAEQSKSWFNLMHVVRLLEACARAEASGRGVSWRHELQAAWQALRVDEREEMRHPTAHPLPLILWKWGSALAYQGELSNAKPLLDKAIQSLEAQDENTTLQVLALGARCDRLALLALRDGLTDPAYRRNLRELAARLAALSAVDLPASQRTYLLPWHERLRPLQEELDAGRAAQGWRALAWDIAY